MPTHPPVFPEHAGGVPAVRPARCPVPPVAVAVLLAATDLAAQNLVQISEVDYDAQWLEIANFDTRPVDLGAWSIYQATHTTGLPQAYWWPIPPGTVVPAGALLRVRWLNPIQSGNTNPLLIDTGETSYHFLFYLRAEPLDRSSGALALVATKDAAAINTASFYRDFVAWGAATQPFAREDLAVQNGCWVTGVRTATAGSGQSLALDARDLREPTPAAAFFRDSSPTPGLPNHGSQSTATWGNPCVLGLGEPAPLRFVSIPVHGNADFRVVVENVVGERTTLTLLWGMRLPAGWPWVEPCRAYVDLAGPWTAQSVTPAGNTAAVRPDLEHFTIPEIAVQAVALRPNGSTVLSNGGVLRN
jgi:hypothetical protein